MVRGGRGHQAFRHLTNEFVQTALLEQGVFTNGDSRHLTEHTAEGPGQGDFTL